MHVSVSAYMHICCLHTHIYREGDKHEYICMHVCVHACIYKCIHLGMYVDRQT